MSEPDPDIGSGAETRQHPTTTSSGERSARLHQPWRVVVAALELVAAVLLTLGACWAWRQAIVPIELPQLGGRTVTRMLGHWIVSSFVLATVAGLLVLDAVRQLVLASRTRPGRVGGP